jgi:AraC family transcriptional regulator, transcriptional activator of pobA
MADLNRSRSIQSYNLFGESGNLPDVVHCETIAARSAFYDWTIEPHRHERLHQLLLVESGGGEARLEDQSFKLSPKKIVNVPIGVVHGYTFARDTHGWVLTIATEVLDQVLVPSEGLRRVLSVPLVLTSTGKMRSVMKELSIDFGGRQFGRAHVLRALTGMLVGLVAREMASKAFVPDVKTNTELFERFEVLLEERYREHWNVSRYAAALSITPTHLSRITRSVTGHGASQLIIDRIIREGRRNLVYTNLSISKIAYSLGFRDPAYFSRLFSEVTGLAPREFRHKFLSLAPKRNATN